jgi:acyl carrier protein
MYDGAICSVIDLTSAKTPDLMLWLEKQFGKEITTRTWKTVERIRNVMEQSNTGNRKLKG